MATVSEQIQEIYIGLLGRAADKTGLDYWVQQITSNNLTIEQLRANIVNEQAEYQNGLGSMTRTQVVTELYNRLFERAPEADGLEYWVNGDGASVNVDQLVLALSNGASTADRAVLDNKIEAAEYYTANVATYTAATAQAAVDSVDGTAASVQASKNATDALGTTGQNVTLTEDRDNAVGTADNDKFFGDVGQNDLGAVSNAFSSGDRIDGGDGVDELHATLVNDNEVDGSDADVSINARTENLEKAFLGVIDDETVTVDAGRMNAVDEFWSDDSDGSLVLEDVRLGTGQNITKDITFGMRDVDQQSGLAASFETQSLKKAGDTTVNSQLLVRIADVSTETPDTPLANVSVNLSFDLGSETITLENVVSTDGTYAGLVTAIDNALIADGYPQVNVQLSTAYTQVTFADNTVTLPFTAQEILLTDPNGNAFNNVNFTQSAIQPVAGGFLVAGNAEPVDPSTSSNMIESNLILDNAGRGSTAGDAVIGGMSNSGQGVEKLNLTVDRDSKIDDLATATGMENFGFNSSGNYQGALSSFKEIEITSINNNGSLSINDIQQTTTVNADTFAGASLKIGEADDLQTLNANIAGNVDVTATTAAAANVYTTGSGSDKLTVVVDGDDVDTIGESFAANTGAGNDTVKVTMTGGNVSHNSTEDLNNLSINTAAGADDIEIVGGTTNGTVNNAGNADGDANFNISAGADSDFVRIESEDDAASSTGIVQVGTVTLAGTEDDAAAETVDFTITDTGGTSTFTATVGANAAFTTATVGAVTNVASTATYTATVNNGVVTITSNTPGLAFTVATVDNGDDISSGALVVTQTAQAANLDLHGTWTVGAATEPQTWTDRVLYQAELTVTFAGFEQKVTIDTDAAGNFVADQITINNAIKAAIAANSELSRLLETSEGTASKQMTITSTVEGLNDLTITVNQPEVVANGATAGQVNLANADQSAMQTGLVQTGVAADSSAADSAAKIVTLMAGIDGNLKETGVADADGSGDDFLLDSTDGNDGNNETSVTNYSVIDMGTGANDLVVLNSDDDSVNTLDFTAAWGKVSVLNWFTNQQNDTGTNGALELSDATTGNHKLDFTHWLNDETSASGSTLSEVRTATKFTQVSAAADLNLESNEVVVVNNFAQNGTETWAAMTAANVDTALEGAADAYGNFINNGSTAVADPANNVGTGISSILMVENDQNQGEYKVFNVETDASAADGSEFTVTLIGTIDFGESIDSGNGLALANFV